MGLMVDAKLNTENTLFDNRSFDSTTALASLHLLQQRLEGLNRDKVSMLSMRERIDMNGSANIPQAVPHRPANVANLLIDTEEKEKSRIARELHDGIGQLLTSINLHTQQCLNATDGSEEVSQVVKESLQVISNMTKQAMAEMRGICCALRPAILDDLGVLAAIKWQCRQISRAHEAMNVTAEYDVSEDSIPENYKTAIYRIVQEALNNAMKYAGADNLLVRLDLAGDCLQLTIKDDGAGFEAEQAVGGMGLISMRERAESVGAAFQLKTREGEGVELRVLFPIEKAVISG